MKKDWHLRFAITGNCNFRCKYCNPKGKTHYKSDMPFEEVKEILQATYNNGVDRVHYTGGEPFLRPDFIKILELAKEIGFKEQVVTTNGFNLYRIINDAKKADLTRAIISMDTVNPEKFKEITGTNFFENTVKSVIKSAEILESPTKISCVTMKDTLEEMDSIIEFASEINNYKKNKGKVIIKFNQFHPDNVSQLEKSGQEFFSKKYVTDKEMINELKKIGDLTPIKDVDGDNPSYRYYKIHGKNVIVGILAMMSWNFPCGRCRKLRVQPSGKVMVCKNYPKSPSLLGKSLGEKEQIIKDYIHYRDVILDKEKPNRIHYYDQLGEERWGAVGKGMSKEKFYEMVKEI
jgi:GTP 3',8-cyclase